MWIVALLGMGTKYAECTLGIHFREDLPDGTKIGGPFAFLEKGAGLRWLAITFAVFSLVECTVVGGMIQSNSAADACERAFGISPWVSGVFLSLLIFIVILGGIKWVGEVTVRLVPTMGMLYLTLGLGVLALFWSEVPSAWTMILNDAFTGSAAAGGFAGATFAQAIKFGAARGLFSNEAGLGTAPMAHSAARTESAVKQGMVSMLGPFIDSIVVCSITGLAIVSTQVYVSGETGAELTQMAFAQAFGHTGEVVVMVAVILFAFSTALANSYYARQCILFITKQVIGNPLNFARWYSKIALIYSLVFVSILFIGAISELETAWTLGDIALALAMTPNLIGIWLLSGLLKGKTNEFLKTTS
jgi:AGCS family alanine or glycine:cation symporter